MNHAAYKSKIYLVVRSSMPPCPGDWAEIVCVAVYYVRADHIFGAGIKCWHCIQHMYSPIWCTFMAEENVSSYYSYLGSLLR